MEALKGKLIEFNAKAPSNLQLGENQINQLISLGKNHLFQSYSIFSSSVWFSTNLKMISKMNSAFTLLITGSLSSFLEKHIFVKESWVPNLIPLIKTLK